MLDTVLFSLSFATLLVFSCIKDMNDEFCLKTPVSFETALQDPKAIKY